MIRPLTYDDINAVVTIGRLAHSQSDVWGHIKFDERVLRGTIARAINDKNAWAYVHETKGDVDGVLIGVTHQLWFSTQRMATDMWTHSLNPGAGLKLLKGFTKWAKERSAIVVMGVSYEYGKDEQKLYERIGLQRAGGIYATGGAL